MGVDQLRRYRRVLSAAVSLSAIAVVMTKVGGNADPATHVGWIAAMGFVVSFALLVIVWRKEHSAEEAAFADRERQQLAMMKLQVELAKKRVEQRAAGKNGD
jgi:hypothetical protein